MFEQVVITTLKLIYAICDAFQFLTNITHQVETFKSFISILFLGCPKKVDF